ncbi:MAG: exodeoxyribonuclease III [Candidatus Aenigmarchaeota archaeon]|nr:exodeoxyribonuclease III [Candidatus Aenigmarchaeota archaeon]
MPKTLRILSWNVNGIRSVNKKGFLDFLKEHSPDILCIQEIKSDKKDIPPELTSSFTYKTYWNPAEKRGYSGTAIFTKQKPLKVEYNLGIERFDKEGRSITVEYPDFILINLYFPHGGRNKENMPYKLETYRHFQKYTENNKEKPVILCGDFNIAHKEIDLERPKDNKDNTMFTNKERKCIDNITDAEFTDTFRLFNKESRNYTWWPYMKDLRKRNIGWRIDYIFVSKSLKTKVKDAFILKEVKGSDHCPIGMKIDIS